MFKPLYLSLWLSMCPALFAQSVANPKSFTIDAQTTVTPDHMMHIVARSPRPLWQAVENVRRRYGWAVDYEDPIYPAEMTTTGPANTIMLKGGSFIAAVRVPSNDSVAEEKRTLIDLVEQYNKQGTMKYRVIVNGNSRFDVVPSAASVLDEPVSVDDAPRSLRSEVDTILNALSAKENVRAVQGGLISNSMEQTIVTLHHTGPVPARQLLEEALDQAPDQKVWIFTFEPDGSYFGLGIQPAEKWMTGVNGRTVVKVIANPSLNQNKKD